MRSTNWSTTNSPTTTASTLRGLFALQVWTNNAWVAAQCIGFSILLGIPIPWLLFHNALNLGGVAGLMFNAGKGDIMLGLGSRHTG